MDDTITAWTAAARLGAADLVEGLDGARLARPSLCAGWTVLEVAAHMTLATRTGWREFLPAIARARGNIDRMEADAARRRAAGSTAAELVAQLRETAWSTRRSPGSGPLDPLVDGLVHTQDMARPLGLVVATPPEAAAAALGHVLTTFFYGAKKRFRGLRVVAEDVDFAAGDGDEVRGGVADLLLVATGRPAGLAGLTGPGVARLGS